LKSMMVNFNIFPGQQITTFEHQWTTLVRSGDYRVRNRIPPPTSLKQFDVLQEEWYKITLYVLQNLYKSIARACDCIEGIRWSNTIVIKKCVPYL
jgi:hypothetical protein